MIDIKLQYSQAGEDVILREIFQKIEKPVEWICEFGAWDGVHLSNTFTFVANNNANAINIEGDKEKFFSLKRTAEQFSTIVPINQFVDYNKHSKNNLDNILSSTDIPKVFDILSIDINSDDLDVWQSLKQYSPICVIIEINNLIPPGIYRRHKDFSQEQIKNKSDTWLNSFSSTIDVGLEKGYTPIKHIGWNLIFIKNDYADQFHLNTTDNYNSLFNFRWIDREKRRKAKEAKRLRKRFKKG